jgi:HD-like signal output (HDOD) protein
MKALGEWVTRLSGVNLPVLRSTLVELGRLRAMEDDVTARDLSATMLRDPLMTVRVLRFSQARLTHRQPTEVTTVEHAIMMHGVARFFREFQALPALEDVLGSNRAALEGALAVISRSYHASINARIFSAQRHDMEGEEVAVSALLHHLAELLLWCTEPAITLQIERMLACTKGLRSASAQRAVLGFAGADLQLALVREWQLPRLLTTLMDHTQSQNARVKTVRVSVSIARHSAYGWDDAGLPDDYTMLQGLLNVTADLTRKHVRQAALLAARQWRAFGVRPAAAWLPALPGMRPITAVRVSAVNVDRAQEVLHAGLRQLENVDSSVEQKAVVAIAIYLLESGAGLRRVWFGSADAKTRRVEAVQHLFLADGLAVEDLAFEIGSGHLFDRLFERGQALWHSQERSAKLTALLPSPLREKIAQGAFFAMGLTPPQKPPALIYADAGPDGRLDEAGYNAFKRVCLALTHALQCTHD